jgi:putative alpha-1,2-mannosidase
MAAWYLLGAMGFYPVCPGKAEYIAGSPLFDRITLRMPDGKTTRIENRGQNANAVYVLQLLVDGKPRESPVLTHEEIARGAQLIYEVSTTPATVNMAGMNGAGARES